MSSGSRSRHVLQGVGSSKLFCAIGVDAGVRFLSGMFAGVSIPVVASCKSPITAGAREWSIGRRSSFGSFQLHSMKKEKRKERNQRQRVERKEKVWVHRSAYARPINLACTIAADDVLQTHRSQADLTSWLLRLRGGLECEPLCIA